MTLNELKTYCLDYFNANNTAELKPMLPEQFNGLSFSLKTTWEYLYLYCCDLDNTVEPDIDIDVIVLATNTVTKQEYIVEYGFMNDWVSDEIKGFNTKTLIDICQKFVNNCLTNDIHYWDEWELELSTT
jgi:hypothetical protein